MGGDGISQARMRIRRGAGISPKRTSSEVTPAASLGDWSRTPVPLAPLMARTSMHVRIQFANSELFRQTYVVAGLDNFSRSSGP